MINIEYFKNKVIAEKAAAAARNASAAYHPIVNDGESIRELVEQVLAAGAIESEGSLFEDRLPHPVL